jgi:hypothetical protein
MVYFHYPDTKDDLRLDNDDNQLPRSWTMMAGMSLLFLTVAWFMIRRVDFP